MATIVTKYLVDGLVAAGHESRSLLIATLMNSSRGGGGYRASAAAHMGERRSQRMCCHLQDEFHYNSKILERDAVLLESTL